MWNVLLEAPIWCATEDRTHFITLTKISIISERQLLKGKAGATISAREAVEIGQNYCKPTNWCSSDDDFYQLQYRKNHLRSPPILSGPILNYRFSVSMHINSFFSWACHCRHQDTQKGFRQKRLKSVSAYLAQLIIIQHWMCRSYPFISEAETIPGPTGQKVSTFTEK